MTFMGILESFGLAVTISGISAKDVASKFSNQDKARVEQYFKYLVAKQVLVAPFDDEVNIAVIKSLESIKLETEKMRIDIQNEFAQHLFLDLVHTLSKELMQLYKRDASNNDVLFYKSLQVIRYKFARVLSVLCLSFKIDLSANQAPLAKLVLEHAYRPR
ncbi:TPA: hypothetical protein ACVO0G_004849 [Vibrio diabolicus]